MRDNGGNNTQITGPISIKVAAGATISISSYENYTSYTVSVNGVEVAGEQTGTTYEYTVTEDAEVIFTNVSTNNYWYSLTVTYAGQNKISENTSITFGSNGNYKDSKLNQGTCTFADNGGDNTQIKNGSFSLEVAAGATVTINGYPGYTSYTVQVNDGEVSAEITDQTYIVTATEDSVITITPVSGNNYLYGIDVAF